MENANAGDSARVYRPVVKASVASAQDGQMWAMPEWRGLSQSLPNEGLPARIYSSIIGMPSELQSTPPL